MEGISLIGIDMANQWFKQGNCYGKDTDIFFPETGNTQAARKAVVVCKGCPVAAECLSYALNNNEKFGVWGGFTVRRRRKLRQMVSIPCTPEDCKRKFFDATV